MSERGGAAELESEWSNFRAFQIGRVSAIVAASAAILAIDQIAGTTTAVRTVYLLLLIDLLLTIPYFAVAKSGHLSLSRLALAILVVEVLLVTVGEYLWGGENAVYGLPLYGFLVVMAAALHSQRAAFLIAFLSATAYGAMVAVTEGAWIPRAPSPFQFAFTDVWPWATTISNSMAILALAVIAGGLSESMRRALARSRDLERELRRVNQGLETRVDIAVQELRTTNQSLSNKNRALERTSRQVELFAQAVAHDLRNPLTAASEALRLRESRDGEMRKELLTLARENLSRADRMLMGLRDLMRIAGAQPESSRTNAYEVMSEVLAEFADTMDGQGLPVTVLGELDDVVALPMHVRHVFRNLIGNALEHNRDLPDLRIEVGQELRVGMKTFFVRDNGAGVPPELRERIFAPFHRGPDAAGGGLGLGLALVHALVQNAGGEVWVDETAGGGATFRFTLAPSGSE